MTQVLRDPADCRSVAPTVVVQDDRDLGLQLADVVERLVRHAAGERTVADDDHDLAGVAAQLARGGETERVAEPGGGGRVLEKIYSRLPPRGLTAETAA